MMNAMNTTSAPNELILKLLWAGKPEEAREVLNKSRSDAEAAMQGLQAQIAEQKAMLDGLSQMTAATHPGTQNRQEDKDAKVIRRYNPVVNRSHEDPGERRDVVIRSAIEVGRTAGGPFNISKVIAALEKEKFDLGVESNRRGTSIGNILNKSSQFNRIAAGVYEYKPPQLQLSSKK